MKLELEVIAFDLISCTIAEKNGADRIELCANPHEGGTTPSIGMIETARKITSIQLFPIIRPRGGDFLYTDHEFQSMIRDIKACKELGCDGVVIGMLQSNGSIDMKRTAELIQHAKGMQITFHRAFDRVQNPIVALSQLIELGCDRVLTSGLHPTAPEGSDVLRELVSFSSNRIKIMVGSGVKSENIESLALKTQAPAYHASARKSISSSMSFENQLMNEQLQQITIDGNEVSALRKIIDSIHF
jgi:copper homeostasis protein